MSRIVSIVCLLAVLCFAIPPATAAAAPPALPSSCFYMNQGFETRIVCLPFFWNHDLVVFAHGYEFYDPTNLQPKLGDEQWKIQLGNGSVITLPQLLNLLGFGFAATSYSKNGLTVLEGVDEMKDLVVDVRGKVPGVRNVYIVGASEGGLITALSMERNPATYKGGLALCGPVGDFQKQINYWGNFRALFDALFPGTLPPTAVWIPDELMMDWVNPAGSTAQGAVIAQLSNPENTLNVGALLNLSGAPVDPAVPATVVETTLGILSYNILATNEARVELSKNLLPSMLIQPYDNTALIPFWLSLTPPLVVQPYAAEGNVAAAIGPYQTTGLLTKPLVTMHNVGDPIVPVWHEVDYALKVAMQSSGSKLTVLPIKSYGHCVFKPAEILYSFAMMLYQSNRLPIKMGMYQEALDQTEPGAFAEFEALNAQFGDLSNDPMPNKIYLPVLSAKP